MKHYTPTEIATELSRFAPYDIQALLEPSVGNGNLLTPFLMRNNVGHIVAIDKDRNAIQDLISKHENDNISFINEDFLEWQKPANENLSFDCVVMNPPFMGKNKALIKVDLKEEQITNQKSVKHLPMEVVFVLRAIKLLKTNGKLLAIVPASVINSSKMSWLREHILSLGHIERVYELPRYTFKGIEAKTFLLVFQKNKKSESTILALYDNGNTQEEIVSKEEIKSELRFDYSYFTAKRKYERYLNVAELGWTSLNKIATISRGKVSSPFSDDDVIHYTNFSEGFWQLQSNQGKASPFRLSNYLICKRVGRDCLSTYGLGIDTTNARFSDCVITIHIKGKNIDKIALLFSLRTFFTLPEIESLLKMGTGAAYISVLQLRKTYIPVGLHKAESKIYKEYKIAVNGLDYKKMKQIELAAASKINEYSNLCCLYTDTVLAN